MIIGTWHVIELGIKQFKWLLDRLGTLRVTQYLIGGCHDSWPLLIATSMNFNIQKLLGNTQNGSFNESLTLTMTHCLSTSMQNFLKKWLILFPMCEVEFQKLLGCYNNRLEFISLSILVRDFSSISNEIYVSVLLKKNQSIIKIVFTLPKMKI